MSNFYEWASNGVGNILGTNQTTKPNKDNAGAVDSLDAAKGEFGGINAPDLTKVHPERVNAQQSAGANQGPTAFNGISVNPEYNQAQAAQMAAYRNLAQNGGRSAASDANLAQIQQQENANAQGQRGAIMQNMSARGMGSSGNSLLARLQAQQGATNNQSAQDMQVRAQQENTALQAGQGAANIAAGMHAQDYGEQAQRAGAEDAIDRFNTGNTIQNNQFNASQGNDMGRFNSSQNLQSQQFNSGLGQQEFADQMGLAGARAGGDFKGMDYWGNKYGEDQRASAGILGGVANILGGAAAGSGKSAGASAVPAAAAASRGGQVPGEASVKGDSYANDTVNLHVSPGEVVVPRTVVNRGDSKEIADFVKNPPAIDGTSAKRAALKRLASR